MSEYHPHGSYLLNDTRPMRRVIHVTAAMCGVEPEDIVGKDRTRKFTRPRFAAIVACREYLEASYPEIGRAFNRDHSSVINAERRFREAATPADWRDIREIAKRAKILDRKNRHFGPERV